MAVGLQFGRRRHSTNRGSTGWMSLSLRASMIRPVMIAGQNTSRLAMVAATDAVDSVLLALRELLQRGRLGGLGLVIGVWTHPHVRAESR